ncbi:hypothetical protein AZI86_01525 [Bdellovibrio bacteriovorus]|uniref:Integral membrane bound transporter domain-containing protein n=1 Tax=Bdellovibrio bacteriovorus TaxID=959 RepID=A0A150WMR5_BDEBC|nr:FUSC family protein [Bdellovibrio bacteriovorus]KYG65781.1 hypothetical protein AZI86_01525 [Bdellovibrio bacteriovorus]
MGLRYHLQEALKVAPAPWPWTRMIVCGGATILPLIYGLLTQQLSISIFGALTGFLLVLNDHLGTLAHRLIVISLTFIFMAFSLSVGVLVQGQELIFIPLLLVLVYWMALMSGEGAELERGLLFGIFQLIAGAYTPGLKPHLGQVFVFALMGYICVIVLLLLIVFLRRHTPNPFARLRATLKKSLTREKHRHLFAVIYCATVLVSILVVQELEMSHGYWAVGTVLIILRPDTKQSIYRGIQRFIGTLLGVIIAEGIIYSVHSPWAAIPIIGVVAFISPWALVRSYWWGSGMIAIMLLLLLDLPSIQNGDFHTPLIRLQATGIGCLLALIGVALMNTHFIRSVMAGLFAFRSSK